MLRGFDYVGRFRGTQPHTSSHTVVRGEAQCSLLTLIVWGHKYSFSIYQPLGINPCKVDKIQNTKLHDQHVKSIIYCKVPGIAHRRLMAFYQGSLEGCRPAPPAAQLPLTQGRFSSRAHFPKMHLL